MGFNQELLLSEMTSSISGRKLPLDGVYLQSREDVVEWFGPGMGSLFGMLNGNPGFDVEFMVYFHAGKTRLNCQVFDRSSGRLFAMDESDPGRFLSNISRNKRFFDSMWDEKSYLVEKRMWWSVFSSLGELKMKLELLGYGF